VTREDGSAGWDVAWLPDEGAFSWLVVQSENCRGAGSAAAHRASSRESLPTVSGSRGRVGTAAYAEAWGGWSGTHNEAW